VLHIHSVTERGDIRVQFHIGDENNEDQSLSIAQQNRWTFHPGALSKIHSFTTGDQVLICADKQRLRHAQKGHGEWSHDLYDWCTWKTRKSFTGSNYFFCNK
jgi:E3 ubiquitin-protein ligase mind-bomb